MKWYFPFKKSPGKAVDITMPVEEGERYRLEGDHLHAATRRSPIPRRCARPFKIKDGDIFDTEAIRKGLESLRKAYAALGYINFTPVPNTDGRR